MFLKDLPYEIPDPSLNNQFNFAAINEFYCVALDVPGVAFYAQDFNLPSIEMVTPSDYQTPFADIPMTGTNMRFEPLRISFIVNENFLNYKSVVDWLFGIVAPENDSQFINQINKKAALFPHSRNVESMLKSDIHVIGLNSDRESVCVVNFMDCFPVNLSGLEWSSKDTNVNYLKATVTFKYTLYKFI